MPAYVGFICPPTLATWIIGALAAGTVGELAALDAAPMKVALARCGTGLASTSGLGPSTWVPAVSSTASAAAVAAAVKTVPALVSAGAVSTLLANSASKASTRSAAIIGGESDISAVTAREPGRTPTIIAKHARKAVAIRIA